MIAIAGFDTSTVVQVKHTYTCGSCITDVKDVAYAPACAPSCYLPINVYKLRRMMEAEGSSASACVLAARWCPPAQTLTSSASMA